MELLIDSCAFVSGSHLHHPIAAAEDDNSPIPAAALPKRRIPRPVAPNDWSKANNDPAATEPIDDCHAAAADPTDKHKHLHSTICVLQGMILTLIQSENLSQ